MTMTLIRHAFALLLTLCGLPALAVNYTIPGSLPPGCTGSGASYTCPGGGSLGYNDTVTIASATPITITVTGSMATNNARINPSGTASNLTLIVNGTLTAEYQAVLNANVQATVFNGSGSEVVVGGNLTATGAITLGYRTRVNGNVSGTSLSTGTEITFGGNVATTTGALAIGGTSTVAGSVSSTSGAISLANSVQVAGQVSCSCALTLANMARVTGNVSAASVTATSQAYLLGSVTTSGAVDLAYATTLSGAVTAGGAIRLRGNTQAPQCLRSTSSSAITLEWADRANGGVCCGSAGACTSSCVVNNSGAAMPALCSGAAPSRFNAFDTVTASGAVSGAIHTKVSGSAFSVAVVAVNTAGTGVATTFTGNVRVEVLNASNNTGAVNSTTGCRASWTVASGTSGTTLTFAGADAGRKNVSLTVAEAFPDAVIRVSYPDTGTPTVVGCSTDHLAIRPASFSSFSVTDSTSSSAGTTRTLANANLTTGNVHKAGQPFTVRATAVNSSGATTTLYTGTPTAVVAHCSVGTGTVCGGTLGVPSYSPTNTSGVLIASNATYSEGGAVDLQLVDSSFANVDATDGSTTAERNITSSTLTVGRFVPDHFNFTITAAPQLQTFGSTCTNTRSFTYFGQPFGYATLPRATVTARNATNGLVANYPTAKLNALQGSFGNYLLAASGHTLDVVAGTTGATSTYMSASTADVQATSTGHTLTLRRSNTVPQSELLNSAYNISMDWTVSDPSETTTGSPGNETISGTHPFATLTFDTPTNAFRYGQLKLGSAYGSELIALAVPMETQYWNGTGFVTNTLDSCTVLPTQAVSLANFRGNLSACRTAPTAAGVAFSSGRAVMRLAAPGNGFKGSVDGTVQLGTGLAPAGAMRCAAAPGSMTPAVPGNLPWLQGKAPGGSTFDQNPSARFSFGQYKSPLIQLREMY